MKKYIYSLLFLTILSAYAHASEVHSAYAPDTLQRELTLQKEYVPVGHQAEKATFNPLDTRGKVSLTPIEFAKNTYQVGMNVTPKLFNPLQNPLAPEYPQQKFHARLFGGYPLYLGGNLGFASKIGDRGAILLGLDHLSRKNLAAEKVTPFAPQNITHDTELGMKYNHALENRVLQVGIDAYHHLHSYHGHFLDSKTEPNIATVPLGENSLEEAYNLFRFNGITTSLSISPAPFSLLSGWQYSANANIGINRKEDPTYFREVAPIIRYGKETSNPMPKRANEVNVNLSGNLGYTFSGSDWGVGIDGRYQSLHLSKSVLNKELQAKRALSIAPHVQYISPIFLAKAGIKIETLFGGHESLLITPDVELKWRATPLLSLYAMTDGGAEFMGLRELYRLNRYADATSVYSGYNIAKYRLLVGLQMGNYNGFAFDLYGGYTNYSAFSEWDMYHHSAPHHPAFNHEPFGFVTFQRANHGAVDEAFLSALARYVSNFGLNLSASWKFSKYSRRSDNDLSSEYYFSGIPMTEINVTADYDFTDKLSAGMIFNGLGGITFYPTAEPYHMPFIPELDARVSYKAHKNLGLSLIGKNIFNNKTARWMFYERPGATIVGAITITL